MSKPVVVELRFEYSELEKLAERMGYHLTTQMYDELVGSNTMSVELKTTLFADIADVVEDVVADFCRSKLT